MRMARSESVAVEPGAARKSATDSEAFTSTAAKVSAMPKRIEVARVVR
jgi:hypothetical protein